MNNKELITSVAMKMNITKSETQELLDSFLECCISQLKEGNSIGFQSFGVFDVVKRVERVSVHPSTKKRSLIPPKLVLNFKQSLILKEKINTKL
ncbi:MAG: HU family DNA-binding protein [Bacteroidales bacterium]|nr:HU family DNA-binding protein [Bacteroidales bacterium]